MNGSSLQLSVLQHRPTPADVPASVLRIEKAIEEARQAGSSLLVVPEASLTGYNVNPATASEVALANDDAALDGLARHCAEYDMALVVGYIERTPDALFNSACFIDADGHCALRYRKTHLWGTLDRSLFQPGDALTRPIKFAGFRLALLICYDVEFPETVRQLALDGADLLLVPTALMQPFSFVANVLVPARAAESQLYVAYANYCGKENGLGYVGCSCIVAPTGEVLARAGEAPELLHARLSRDVIDKAREQVPYLCDRRPELYGAIGHVLPPGDGS